MRSQIHGLFSKVTLNSTHEVFVRFPEPHDEFLTVRTVRRNNHIGRGGPINEGELSQSSMMAKRKVAKMQSLVYSCHSNPLVLRTHIVAHSQAG